MATLLGGIVINGVESLRKEIAALQEILHTKTQRLHEMESFLIRLQGRPSSVSYEAEVLDTSIITIATVDAPTSALKGDLILHKLKDKEVLKIYYKSEFIGTGILHFDTKEKKGYYILDKDDKKKYNIMSKWSLAKKKEKYPEEWADKKSDDGTTIIKKTDNAKRSVNCYREGKWIKLSELS
jgi:hypothetical protein